MSRHHMPKKPGRNPRLLCCGGKIPASEPDIQNPLYSAR
jgi:hypothetical protein